MKNIPMIMMAAALAGTLANGVGVQAQSQNAAKLFQFENGIKNCGSQLGCGTEESCNQLKELLESCGITLPEGSNGVIVVPGGSCDETDCGDANGSDCSDCVFPWQCPDVELPDAIIPEFNTPGNMDTWFPEIEIPENPGSELPEVEKPESPENGTPEAPEEEQPDTEKPEEDEDSEDENSLTAYEQQVVNLVNEERAKAGLSAVKVDVQVSNAADVRSKEIVSSFSHTRPDGRSFSTVLSEAGASFRGAGENIAWGQKSPEAVMEAWMNSSGHRANILNEKYTTIGVGCYEQNGILYWTQLFTY